MAEQPVKPTKEKEAPAESRQDRLLHAVLSAAFAAMLVATPLLPSDTYSLAIDGQIAAPAMLWLMLAICACAAWLLQMLQTRKSMTRFTNCDALVCLFFVWTASAGVIASTGADRRAGWNMTASWVSLGMTYLLARLLVRESMHLRAMVVGIIALTLMFSTEGIYEAWVVIPANQASFRQNPAAVLEAAGITAQRGTLLYEQFRSRLETQSPSATFALENSFAGYLIPGFILMVGLLFGRRAAGNDQRSMLQSVVLLVGLVVVAYCIYLTHSRAAIVALGVSLLVAAVAILFRDRSPAATSMRYGIACVLLLIFLWPLLAAFTGPDFANRLPLTLRYRAEYWQSCAAMMTHFPLWGCGPGNFQDAYARFMLPQAAETIADPHNLIWEVLCTSGIVAGVLFVSALSCAGWRPLRDAIFLVEQRKYLQLDSAESAIFPRLLTLGAVAGVPLALLLSLSTGSGFLLLFLRSWLLIGAVPAIILVAALASWVRGGTLSFSLIWLAWLALAIHLTVSGGIANPGTGTLFFFLLAVTQMEKPLRGQSFLQRNVSIGLATLAAVCIFAAAHYLWGYVPVLAAQAALHRAEIALAANQPSAGKAALEEAAKADAWSSAPYTRLALLEFHAYADAQRRDPQVDPTGLIAATQAAVAHSKTSPAIHYEMALTLLRANLIVPHDELVANAQELLARATQLAPSKAVAWAYLAYAHAKAGSTKNAVASAAEALRLDAINPHEHDLGREPCPVPGRNFPGWLRELTSQVEVD